MYDVTNQESFLKCQNYFIDIIEQRFLFHKGQLPVVLVGGQIDKTSSNIKRHSKTIERQVSFEAGLELSKSMGIPFLETTALAITSVNNIFKQLVQVYEKSLKRLETVREPEPEKQLGMFNRLFKKSKKAGENKVPKMQKMQSTPNLVSRSKAGTFSSETAHVLDHLQILSSQSTSIWCPS